MKNFVKNQEVSSWCDDFKKQKKIEKSHFSAYGKLLAEKDVLLKSKPLNIWSFGENDFFLSWWDDLKKQKKTKKIIFRPAGND